jgi:hypothetical protein
LASLWQAFGKPFAKPLPSHDTPFGPNPIKGARINTPKNRSGTSSIAHYSTMLERIAFHLTALLLRLVLLAVSLLFIFIFLSSFLLMTGYLI